MEVTAYRGVEYGEALEVVERQSYLRAERRTFAGGIRAKAVFGPGVYLVSNPRVAAEYAYCHAETSWDKGAILQQRLTTRKMIRLDDRYGENELREEALRWKYTDSEMLRLAVIMEPDQWLAWTGEQIRAYLLERGYRGICYRVADDLIYYVSYEPAEQIRAISLYRVFEVIKEG